MGQDQDRDCFENHQEEGSVTPSSPTSDLTPNERQQILRRLKRGPVLSREALAQYAGDLRREVLKKREKVQK